MIEVDVNTRKIEYWTVEDYYGGEIITKNLDRFISFLQSFKKGWVGQNDLCAFFGIKSTEYFKEDKDFPNIDSHCAEKNNLIKDLIDFGFIDNKSSRTFSINKQILNQSNQSIITNVTDEVLNIIYAVGKGERIYSDLADKVRDTCICVFGSGYINWHINKYFPNATVDKLKELGWEAFYDLNKDNYNKKKEYFTNKC